MFYCLFKQTLGIFKSCQICRWGPKVQEKHNIFFDIFSVFLNFKLNLLQYRIGPTLFNHLRGLRAGTMFWLIGYMQLVPIVTVLVILKYIIAV